MKKNDLNAGSFTFWYPKKIALRMKLTSLFLLMGIIQVVALNSYSQSTKLTMEFRNVSVEDALREIEDQSEFYFVYNKDVIDVDRKVNLEAKDLQIEEILDFFFKNTNVNYQVVDRHIILSTLLTNQSKLNIRGKVVDTNSQPLPGVTVVLKGTTNGTITDVDGNYFLSNVPSDETLVFSFVGMRSLEVPVSGKTSIDVVLMEETIGIEEVVAIGYGSMQKSDITSSISEVDVDQLSRQTTSSLDQSLQGLIPGVQVEQTTGNPGGSSSIRIRGSSSVGAGSDPLFVIDGNPMPESYGKNQNPLSWLNPNDIESITVLKDASSTAIYGSRGSNGVILITTKSGKEGKTTVSFNASIGIQNAMANSKMDVMNAHEFATWRYENAQDFADYYGTDFEIDDDYANPDEYGEGTDWQEEL